MMTKICDLNYNTEGESIGVTAEIEGTAKMLIVIRRNKNAFVYINSCPHIGAPLDLQPGKFLSHDKKISFAQPTVRCLKLTLAIVFLAPAKTIILTFFRFRLNGEVLYTG